MKLFTALAAITLIAAPAANALPIWAIQMSRSHCEYLAMGATWDEAALQASRDILPLYPEAKAAGSLRDRAIHAAIDKRCSDLSNRALAKPRTETHYGPAF